MAETNARFVSTIPEHDDRHLGPVIFEPSRRTWLGGCPGGPSDPSSRSRAAPES